MSLQLALLHYQRISCVLFCVCRITSLFCSLFWKLIFEQRYSLCTLLSGFFAMTHCPIVANISESIGILLHCGLKPPCTTLIRPKNKNVHRITHNLHGIKITMVERFPWNISAWCVIVFESLVKWDPIIARKLRPLEWIQKCWMHFYCFLVKEITKWADIFTGWFYYISLDYCKVWKHLQTLYQ